VLDEVSSRWTGAFHVVLVQTHVHRIGISFDRHQVAHPNVHHHQRLLEQDGWFGEEKHLLFDFDTAETQQ
jgi:hypothetical protein